jgi:hypothetical protein
LENYLIQYPSGVQGSGVCTPCMISDKVAIH